MRKTTTSTTTSATSMNGAMTQTIITLIPVHHPEASPKVTSLIVSQHNRPLQRPQLLPSHASPFNPTLCILLTRRDNCSTYPFYYLGPLQRVFLQLSVYASDWSLVPSRPLVRFSLKFSLWQYVLEGYLGWPSMAVSHLGSL